MSVHAIAGILDQVLAFVSDAVIENTQLHTKVAELNVQLGDKVVLEKVASTPLNTATMLKSLEGLVELKILHPEHLEKVAQQIKSNPNQVFELMNTVAKTLMSSPNEGAGLPKESASAADTDPDGWKAMAKGHKVKIVR